MKEENADSNSEEDAVDNMLDVVDVPLVPESFSPLYFMFQWVETLSTRQRLSVVINMPSGTLTTYEICVVGGGFVLQFRVAFPKFMADIERLHEYWLRGPGVRISEDHPKIGASVQALKGRRETGSAAIYSVAHIRLPLKVETDVDYEALEDEEVVDGVSVTTSLLYVELKAATDVYSGTASRKSFKRVRTGESTPTNLGLSPTTPSPAFRVHSAAVQGPQ